MTKKPGDSTNLLRCPSCGEMIPFTEVIAGKIEEGVEAGVRVRLEEERRLSEEKHAAQMQSTVEDSP